MAGLKIEFDQTGFNEFYKLRNLFPEFNASALGFVGHEGKLRLKKLMMQSDLNFESLERDKLGRPIVSYSIQRGGKSVKIGSYPMHLFDKGRILRSGRREPGRKIVTGKLKSLMSSDLQAIVNKFDKTILQKEVNKI